MKKITITVLFLLTVAFTFAQLTEDFSSGVPPTGWIIDANSANWSSYGGGSGGGTAPKAHINWQPQFNGVSRLISPVVDLTGSSTVVLSFEHLYDYYGGAFEYGIATKSGGGSWNTVWTAPNVDVEENKSIEISNSDVGQADFQFCFYISGDSYNFNDILIDDVVLFTPLSNDVAMLPLTMVPFSNSGNVSINGAFKNLGLTTINSLDVNYQIDGNAVVTESFNGLNVTLTNSYDFSFVTPWAATSGNYDITVWVSNINGNGGDDNTANDSASMEMSIATQVTQNLPLYEEFTSATCSPCAGFNTNSFNDAFLNANTGNYSLIKYQMNWPGAGDIYYTAEGGVRRNYYSVSGVPTLVFEGESDNPNFFQNPGLLQSELNQDIAADSYIAMSSVHSIDIGASEIDVEIDINPYLSGDFTLHVVVVEAETTQNVGSNGETYFTNVMMKMIPDASGTAISLSTGTNKHLVLSQSLSGTNIEEMSDLKVIVFIQHDATQKLMQSTNSVAGTVSVEDYVFADVEIYPNPTNGIVTISTDRIIDINLFDVLGKKVFSKNNIIENATLNLNDLDKGVYFVSIFDGVNKGTRKLIIE